jgi:hypothetical protein
MLYRRFCNTLPLVAAFAICAPLAKPGVLEVNGTCYVANAPVGSCPAVDSVSDPSYDPGPGSVAGSFNFNVAVNTDVYNVGGYYTASYTGAAGGLVNIVDTITYSGNNGATSQPDTLTLDLFQNLFDDTPGSWAGTFSEVIPIILTAPAGSTAQGQLLWDGTGVGLAGPYGPGTWNYTNTTHLDFGASDPLSILAGDYNQVVTFATGTTAGIVFTNTPEPMTAIPCGLGVLLVWYVARRRDSSRIAA